MIATTYYHTKNVKREILQQLRSWSKSPLRKPLILQGARQVGKTYIVKELAKEDYENLVYLNFETNLDLATLFTGNLEPQIIINKIEIALNTEIKPRKSLIFFDEIQTCGQALTSLKYFKEKAPDYHIIAAGSLLGITLTSQTSFPVGQVDFLFMHPMNFREFLNAKNLERLSEYLSSIKLGGKIENIFHQQLLDSFKEYCFVGGMPEVVKVYLQNSDLDLARETQQAILLSYQNDFSKHLDPHETLKIRKIWDSIPRQLGKENRKFIFSAVAKSARAREYETALQWLLDSGIVLRAKLVEIPEAPIEAMASTDAFKIFLLDTGLLGARMNVSKSTILKSEDLFMQYRGILAENTTAVELTANNFKNLYYWTSSSQAEIDFLIEHDSKVIPLEVKSGLNKKSKSLNSYIKKHQPKHAFRLSLDSNITKEKIIDLPIYMAGEIGRILNIDKQLSE